MRINQFRANPLVWCFQLGIVIAVASLVIVSCAIAEKKVEFEYSEDLNFTESASGLTKIKIENINGELTFTGSDRSDIQIVASVSIKATDTEIGRLYQKDFKPVIKRSGKTLEIETHRPKLKESKRKRIKKSRIDYEIQIPSRLSVTAETINGSVTVVEALGDIELESINGKIEITSNQEMTGGIKTETINGGVTVHVTSVADGCSFESVNGSVAVTITKSLDNKLSAETVNGNVKLMLPEDAAFTLDANAVRGSIKTDWGKPSKKSFIGKSFEVDVNGGGKSVDVETVNGSIVVRRATL